MKKRISILILLSSLAAQTALAENACQIIEKECLKAGFLNPDPEKNGRDLQKDCLKPLLSGQPVENIVIPNKTLEACRKIRSRFRPNRGHHRPRPVPSPEISP